MLASIAFGAINTSCPAAVGFGAPRKNELCKLGGSRILAQWGLRRQAFYQDLKDRVLRSLETSGAYRVATAETVACIAMVAQMMIFGSASTLLCADDDR